MLDLYDYIAGWAIYLTAGTLCYMIFYRFTGGIKSKPIANTLRAILIALMFTPWYVAPEADLMAPALMVMMLDIITVGTSAFVRAFVPLVLSIAGCVLLALSGTALKLMLSRRSKPTAS
ncbi:MAG: hypothetical protein H7A06_03735 [Pseudomonadales bacterium]|nr:hypothetical protein [Pseudomonadales bacterium]